MYKRRPRALRQVPVAVDVDVSQTFARVPDTSPSPVHEPGWSLVVSWVWLALAVLPTALLVVADELCNGPLHLVERLAEPAGRDDVLKQAAMCEGLCLWLTIMLDGNHIGIMTHRIRDPEDGTKNVVGGRGVGKRVCFQRSVCLLEQSAYLPNFAGRPSNVIICGGGTTSDKQGPHDTPQKREDKPHTRFNQTLDAERVRMVRVRPPLLLLGQQLPLAHRHD